MKIFHEENLRVRHECLTYSDVTNFVLGLSASQIQVVVHQLIICYLEGFGTSKDPKRAFGWMCKNPQRGSLQYQADMYLLAHQLGQETPKYCR